MDSKPDETTARASVEKPAWTATVSFGPAQLSQADAERYQPLKFHARGGMGEIWLARDRDLGREVAVKQLRKSDPERQQRFLAEAQITGQLEHPGIVPVHDLGVDPESRNFYVMKFVQGRTLEQAIDEFHRKPKGVDSDQAVAWRRLLESFIDLCEAIAYAHSRGVIHRDIKPDNVMLGSFGETVVLDWGLAKVVGQPELPGLPSGVTTSSGHSSATQVGSVLGTPAYMSPEMAAGQGAEVGPATDFYLLGATLYKILTGHAPRRGSSYTQMVELARTVPPDPPRHLDKTISRPLEAVCLKALSKHPEDRYSTAEQIADEVRRYLAGEPVLAYPEPISVRAWRWSKRHRREISWTAAAILVLSVAMFGLSKFRQLEDQRQLVLAQNQQLAGEQLARRQVREFRQSYDEVLFRIGFDPPGEQFTYYDSSRGLDAAEQALSLAGNWGDDLEHLPLAGERPRLKQEIYDLLLSRVQLASTQAPDSWPIESMLHDLERALSLREPSRAFYRLRSRCYEVQNKSAEASADKQLASAAPTTALDHFLDGELYRLAAPTRDPQANPLNMTPKRELKAAVAAYRAALQLDPDHFWSRLQLGRCYMNLQSSSEAVEALGACVAAKPESPWALSAYGLALGRQNRFDEALGALNRALELSAAFHPAMLHRGRVYWRKGDVELAIRDFQSVLSATDDNGLIEAAYYLGQLHYDRGDYLEAQKYFSQFVESNTSSRAAYRYLATVHYILGQDEQAAEKLNRYLELGGPTPFDRDAPESRFYRGRFLRNRATGIFLNLSAAANNALTNYGARWEVGVDANQLPQDIRNIVAQPPAERGRRERGLLRGYLRKNDTEFKTLETFARRAREAQTRILKLALRELRTAETDWESAELYYDLGLVLEKLRHPQEALVAYNRGLALEPDSMQLLNKRAFIHWSSGDSARATTDYARATRMKPRHEREKVLVAEANGWLGILLTSGNDRQAGERQPLRTLIALRDVDPEDKHIYLVLHNAACIYGRLSQSGEKDCDELEEIALNLLDQAVQAAQRVGEDEIEIQHILREDEAFFGPQLRAREQFQRLVGPRSA